MAITFDDIASQFDYQRGLPREALHGWCECIGELANGKKLQIIEPGIGTGRVALPLAALGHHITGTDISLPMLHACESMSRQLGLSEHVSLLEAAATALPFDDQSFDLGLVAQLLYLIPDWPSVLDELARVVQPDGYVIHLTEPTTESEALSLWSGAWREIIESTGYRHTAIAPTDDEVHTEFLRRWPDVEIRELASWSFGQTVAEATQDYGQRIRPLYTSVPNQEFNQAVESFLKWAGSTFADPGIRLEGTATLTAMIAHL